MSDLFVSVSLMPFVFNPVALCFSILLHLFSTIFTPPNQVLSAASSMPLERLSGPCVQTAEQPALGPQASGSSPGDIVAVTAAACNTVWVGSDNGMLEQYTSFGRLLNSVGTTDHAMTLDQCVD